MKVFDKTWKLAVAGALVGVLAALLAYFGNPANMAICIACFVRDTAGALKLHSAAPVQYFRPEGRRERSDGSVFCLQPYGVFPSWRR